MLNAIRAGNSVFRSNCKILYKQGVTPQCLLCSSSGSGGDKSEKDDKKDDDDKKTKVGKPVDFRAKKHMKLEKSRVEKGKYTIQELLQGNKPDVKMKDKRHQKGGNEEGKKAIFELLQGTKPDEKLKEGSGHDQAQDLGVDESSDGVKTSHKEPIQVPLASKPKKSRDNLLTLIHEAAVELGGKTDETEKDLLEAYTSMRDTQHLKKQRRDSQFRDRDIAHPVDDEDRKPRITTRLSDDVRLDIFTEKVEQKKPGKVELKVWQKLYAKNLEDLATSPPRNYFEELIHWTNQGKLWHFPIDNEQGMDLEKNISFVEHIFLEKHLEPWCPDSGPIRHFMELVTVGLSKNPYLSVEQKKEHIMWYRDYFENKRKLLEEIGALGAESTSEVESR